MNKNDSKSLALVNPPGSWGDFDICADRVTLRLDDVIRTDELVVKSTATPGLDVVASTQVVPLVGAATLSAYQANAYAGYETVVCEGAEAQPSWLAKQAITLLTILGVGTAGLAYNEQVRDRLEPARRYEVAKVAAQPLVPSEFLSVQEQLNYVKEVLQPSVTDMASIFGVSRQAIYDWQRGNKPTSENVAKLQNLVDVAHIVRTEGIARPEAFLRSIVADGRTLQEIASEGQPFQWAAMKLIHRDRAMADERAQFDVLFANKTNKLDADSKGDIGVPHLAS